MWGLCTTITIESVLKQCIFMGDLKVTESCKPGNGKKQCCIKLISFQFKYKGRHIPYDSVL
jgi:hypothetical protein